MAGTSSLLLSRRLLRTESSESASLNIEAVRKKVIFGTYPILRRSSFLKDMAIIPKERSHGRNTVE